VVADVARRMTRLHADVTHWVPGEASYRVGGRHRRRRGCRRPFNVAALSWLRRWQPQHHLHCRHRDASHL